MFDAKLEAALKGAQPHQQLRTLVLALKAQGQNQRQIYDVFEKFRAQYAKPTEKRMRISSWKR